MSSSRRLAEEVYRIEQLALGHATTPQLGSSRMDGGVLEWGDGDGHIIGRIGPDGNGALDIEYIEGPPPPQPSVPVVTSDAGFVRVRWDGGWGSPDDPAAVSDPDIGSTADADRVEIHLSLDENFVPDPVSSFAGSFSVVPEGGDTTIGPLVESGTYWCVLMARSKAGRYGIPSQRVDIEVSGVNLDSELFDLALRADEAMESADGKNSVYYGDEEPTPRPVLDEDGNPVLDDEGNPIVRGFKDGDIWFGQGNLPHVWSGEAGEWVSAADSRVDAIQEAQDELRRDVERIVTDGTGTTTYWQPTAPDETTTPPPKEGDLWFNTSGGGNELHRFSGGAWVSARDSRLAELQEAIDNIEVDFDADPILAEARDEAKRLADQARDEALAADTRVHMLTASDILELNAALDAITDRKPGDLAVWDSRQIGEDLGTWQYRWTGTEWLLQADQTGTLALGMASRAHVTASGKNRITRSRSNPPTSYTGRTDDLWWVVSSLGSGGQVLSQWRWNGNVWVSETISSAVLAYVDAAKITVGILDADRIGAESIIARHIAAGAIGATAIAAEAIEGRHVKAGSLLADAVLVPGSVGGTLIADGAVTTNHIAAGSITAESGIIESLSAGTITSGILDTARLAAGSITGDKLLIGGERNLLPNGDLTSGSAAGWPRDPAFNATAGPGGGPCVTYPASTNTVPFAPMGQWPVAAGDEVVFEAWVKADTPGSKIFFEVRDQNGAHLRPAGALSWRPEESNAAAGAYPAQDFEVPTEWTLIRSRLVVTSATARAMSLGSTYFNHANGSNRNAAVSIAGLKLYKRAGATLIAGGAITTEKIATGAITAESGIIGSLDAGVITTGELRGELIRAGSIAGQALAADAIDGKVITGATIRTAAAGARVEMNNLGLTQYNAFGQPIVQMTDGALSVVGTLRSSIGSGPHVRIDSRLWTGSISVPTPGEDVDPTSASGGEGATGGTRPSIDAAGVRIGESDTPARSGDIVYARTSDGSSIGMVGPDAGSGLAQVRAWASGDAGIASQDPSGRSVASIYTKSSGGAYVQGVGAESIVGVNPDGAVFMRSGSDGFIGARGKTAWMNNDLGAQFAVRPNGTADMLAGDSILRLLGDGDIHLLGRKTLWAHADEVNLQGFRGLHVQSGGPGRGGNLVVRSYGSIDFESARPGDNTYAARMDLTWDSRSGFIRSMDIHGRTYGSSANVHITSNGVLGRSTSARRYKDDERVIPPSDYADKLLSIPFKSWVDKAEQAAHQELMRFRKDSPMCPAPESLMEAPEELTRHIGAVSEDFLDAGLDEFVEIDQYGQTQGLHYDRIGMALVPIVRDQRDQITELQRELTDLKELINA